MSANSSLMIIWLVLPSAERDLTLRSSFQRMRRDGLKIRFTTRSNNPGRLALSIVPRAKGGMAGRTILVSAEAVTSELEVVMDAGVGGDGNGKDPPGPVSFLLTASPTAAAQLPAYRVAGGQYCAERDGASSISRWARSPAAANVDCCLNPGPSRYAAGACCAPNQETGN